MSIKINRDGITFRNFSITPTVDGIYIDGTFTANGQFVDATQAQGSVSGYVSGGRILSPSAQYIDVIEKFPFASDANASDVGDLTRNRSDGFGQSSSTHGFTSGGFANTAVEPSPGTDLNIIDKFPFSIDTNASDVGDLSQSRRAGASASSSTNGYSSGGGPPQVNTIDKFPFSIASGTASDVGDLTQARQFPCGQSSSTHGYASGGSPTPPTFSNLIDKFPFSIDTNASDVGDLTDNRQQSAGQNSSTHGYVSGGIEPSGPTIVSTIDKFPFASDTNAGEVGDITQARRLTGGVGQSSKTHGYVSGGMPTPPSVTNIIDKFPFSVDSDSSDVGDLTSGKYRPAGQQV